MNFPPEQPNEKFHYKIEGQIGSGSMGIVYRAVDLALDRPVAIKTLRQAVLAEEPPEAQREMRERFLREARAAARLSHPGITVVYHADLEGDVPYMVMEWLDGRTLETLMAERGRLALSEATHLVVSLLDILQAAHREGVIHRDIKPANLMILKDGRLKVTDFGIALLLQGQDQLKTRAGVVLATPRFASPEQLRGDRVDARSDLFSTGVLLYHLLTGAYPFVGQTFIDLASSIMTHAPAPLRDRLPDIPPVLDAVVRRALEKNVQERYTSALEMAEGLRQFITSAIDVGTNTGLVPSVETSKAEGPRADSTQSATAILQIYRDLPMDPKLALVRMVETWPFRDLEVQSPLALLGRLLEKPLHAPAFAGAAQIVDICFFVEDGVLLGAVDTHTGASGDAVAERLPNRSVARIHTLPAAYPARFMGLLTTALHPPVRRQSDLDSTFLNLPAFASKLEVEKFDGLLRLDRGQAWALLIFAKGERALSLFSEGWDEVPIEQSWLSWAAQFPVLAHVEEKVVRPLGFWYRHSLPDFELDVRIQRDQDSEVTQGASSRIRDIFRSPRSDSSTSIHLALHPSNRNMGVLGYENAPSYRLLTWMLKELPGQFAEREKTSGWRYLVEWLAEVRKAHLHHQVPRPKSREADFFDLVTSDKKGKILHLASRVAVASPEALQEFLDRVLQAKQARIKTGDIGGAFFIAPEFDDATLTLYNDTIQKKTATGNFLGLEEALTGYEGFVRVGARRGFHLLLVEEKGEVLEALIPN